MSSLLISTSDGECIVKPEVVVLICADDEWKVVKETVQPVENQPSPFGEWFIQRIIANDTEMPVVFFQTGCGKIPAAAATQYALASWRPKLISPMPTMSLTLSQIRSGGSRRSQGCTVEIC